MKFILLLFLVAVPFSASASEAKRVTPPGFGEAKQPQIAVSDNGTIHVTFGKGDTVYATSSQDAGASFGEPVKVGEVRRLALGMRRGPRIATTENSVIVTAISHDDGNLYAWRSEDDGHSWSKPTLVNTVAKSAVEGLQDLTSDDKSRVGVVWLDLRNGKTELWTSVSKDGGKTWPENTQIYRSPDLTICECCHPSITFTPSGRIVVMWRNWLNGGRDMYRAESSDGGKTFSGATKIGAGTWKLNACPMDGGSLSVEGERIAYTWRREQKLLATTDPASETLISNSGTQPVVVRTQSGFDYLWQDQGNLYWKRSIEKKPVVLARDAGYAASAWNPIQKNSLIVWEGRDRIYAQALR